MTTAADVRAAIRRHYGVTASDLFAEEWAVIDEVKPVGGVWGGLGTTIDMLAVRNWTGGPKGNERHAIEIKVSRGDWRREMASGKWQPWAARVHRFYFATPAGLVGLDDIPDGTGWIEVTGDGGCRVTVRAPVNQDAGPFPPEIAHELARRVCRLSERIRRAADTDPAAALAAYRDDLTRLRAAHDALLRRHRTVVRRAADVERRLAHSVIVGCATCGDRVLPHPFEPTTWRHVRDDGTVSWADDPHDHPAVPPEEYRLTEGAPT